MENKQEDEKAATTAMQLGKGTTQMTTVLNPVKNETVRYIKCSGLFLTRRYSRSIESWTGKSENNTMLCKEDYCAKEISGSQEERTISQWGQALTIDIRTITTVNAE